MKKPYRGFALQTTWFKQICNVLKGGNELIPETDLLSEEGLHNLIGYLQKTKNIYNLHHIEFHCTGRSKDIRTQNST